MAVRWCFIHYRAYQKLNIFYLSECPKEAAELQCDKHVVKMILETAQLLSTAHHELDGKSPAYKPTHKNHPSAVWVRQSWGNYIWAWRHLAALCKQYTARYHKVHKTEREHLKKLYHPPMNLAMDGGFTPPPQCMPDEYKVQDDAVAAYKAYYDSKADEWERMGRPMTWYGKLI